MLQNFKKVLCIPNDAVFCNPSTTKILRPLWFLQYNIRGGSLDNQGGMVFTPCPRYFFKA